MEQGQCSTRHSAQRCAALGIVQGDEWSETLATHLAQLSLPAKLRWLWLLEDAAEHAHGGAYACGRCRCACECLPERGWGSGPAVYVTVSSLKGGCSMPSLAAAQHRGSAAPQEINWPPNHRGKWPDPVMGEACGHRQILECK